MPNSILQFNRLIYAILLNITFFLGSTAFAFTDAPAKDPRVPFIPQNDVQFIDIFQPHHKDAIEMARMVVERGENPQVQAIAQAIIQEQTVQLQDLRGARKELTGKAMSPPMNDPHSRQDMKELESLSGENLDQRFLDHMIAHHASGITSAHRSLRHLKRKDMHQLAESMISSQSTQIGEMQRLRE